ncbi:uncharacterized protein V1516DRAFT_621896 [Lipomyces oligophaga]|uniref:uncharacterized protein n=1 Tax=Lipomyces oligophaga TaxID=45792 RepID=UPI0034CE81E1
MRIAFVHPDLGIGGAERLVVDAALGLQECQHAITIYTSHCDLSHCFDEVRDGKVQVVVRGDFLPRSLFGGRFAILCAIARQVYLTVWLLINENNTFDGVFVDQLPVAVLLIRIFADHCAQLYGRSRKTKILFYCHFPDKLLSTRTSLIKKIYRIPFDILESICTASADTVLVNSKFTQSVFQQAFSSISTIPQVVYPCVSVDPPPPVDQKLLEGLLQSGKSSVVSVNRFERKKNIELAINSYARFSQRADLFDSSLLFIAGGYDEQVLENKEYLIELTLLCDRLQLTHTTIFHLDENYPQIFSALETTHVIFLPSISTAARTSLIRYSKALVYTPTNEHFGIVPLEALLLQTPVLATTSGGPLETIQNQSTGWLRDAKPSEWSLVLEYVFNPHSTAILSAMGQEGERFVKNTFTRPQMAKRIQAQFLVDNAASAQESSKAVVPVLQRFFWFSLLSWAVYYCKYGFAIRLPTHFDLVVGLVIVVLIFLAIPNF